MPLVALFSLPLQIASIWIYSISKVKKKKCFQKDASALVQLAVTAAQVRELTLLHSVKRTRRLIPLLHTNLGQEEHRAFVIICSSGCIQEVKSFWHVF